MVRKQSRIHGVREKFIPQNQIVGQQGINLIERFVLEMGYTWTPTSGANDAGIDGIIEIRDQKTGAVTNLIVQVQSKATSGAWEAETATSLVYRVREKDLQYWLQGNAPVILVVSRPAKQEAYWIPVKPYFTTPERRASCKAIFNKQTQRFDKEAAVGIASQALATDKGIYLRPPPKWEVLTSNLLEVMYYPNTLYIASTPHTLPEKLRGVLKELEERPGELWYLKEKRILSFHDLSEFPWTEVVDQGTVETFETGEWGLSSDQERKNDFVRLLNQTLRQLCYHKGIGVFASKNGKPVFYFRPRKVVDPKTEEVSRETRTETWKLEKNSMRTVVQIYRSDKDKSKVLYYRHHGFVGQFHRFDAKWYLEISPTYHYTRDGVEESRFRAENLAGMKRQEGHQAVANNVRFIAHYLTEHDLLRKEYAMLRFGKLLDGAVEFGIPEADWKNRSDPDEEPQAAGESDAQMELLSE
jgi:hypothetical protein